MLTDAQRLMLDPSSGNGDGSIYQIQHDARINSPLDIDYLDGTHNTPAFADHRFRAVMGADGTQSSWARINEDNSTVTDFSLEGKQGATRARSDSGSTFLGALKFGVTALVSSAAVYGGVALAAGAMGGAAAGGAGGAEPGSIVLESSAAVDTATVAATAAPAAAPSLSWSSLASQVGNGLKYVSTALGIAQATSGNTGTAPRLVQSGQAAPGQFSSLDNGTIYAAQPQYRNQQTAASAPNNSTMELALLALAAVVLLG